MTNISLYGNFSSCWGSNRLFSNNAKHPNSHADVHYSWFLGYLISPNECYYRRCEIWLVYVPFRHRNRTRHNKQHSSLTDRMSAIRNGCATHLEFHFRSLLLDPRVCVPSKTKSIERCREISRLLFNSKMYYCVHNSLPTVFILRQTNLIKIITHYTSKIIINKYYPLFLHF
jgi:hypothetical protein